MRPRVSEIHTAQRLGFGVGLFAGLEVSLSEAPSSFHMLHCHRLPLVARSMIAQPP